MSILIPGKMPERCEECPCCRHDSLDGVQAMQCNLTLTAVMGHGNARLNNCPLIELPPHGRLGDLDALMGRIEHDAPSSSTFEKIVRRYVDTADTIIPEEEE